MRGSWAMPGPNCPEAIGYGKRDQMRQMLSPSLPMVLLISGLRSVAVKLEGR